MTDGRGQYPERADGGAQRQVALATIGLMDILCPALGYSLQQVASWAVPDPLEKRRSDWLNDLAADAKRLKDKVDAFDPIKLVQDEAVITAILEAQDIAVKTHRQTKREILRNTVLNTAMGLTIEEAIRGRLLQCVDQFSEAHIAMLRVLHAPHGYPRVARMVGAYYVGSAATALKPEFDAQGISDDVQRVIIEDLQQNRMIGGDLNALGGGTSLGEKNTLPLGDAFLAFIERPAELK